MSGYLIHNETTGARIFFDAAEGSVGYNATIRHINELAKADPGRYVFYELVERGMINRPGLTEVPSALPLAGNSTLPGRGRPGQAC
jgi:hypothetical protein